MKTYQPITAQDVSSLGKKVNQAIAGGFEPQGGIAIYTTGNTTLFVQAVVSNKPQGGKK